MIRSALAAVVLMAAASAARAQQADSAHADTARNTSSRLRPVVIVSSRISGVDERTPVQVDEINVRDAAPGPGSAAALVGGLAGIATSDDQGSRLQPRLDVRGFDASPVVGQPQGVSVFLDGVRINEPDAQEVNFDLIPMDAVTRAELVRGPSALFGKNSLAGSLLLFTERGAQESRASAEIEGGPYGYRGARTTLSGARGGLDGYVMARMSNESGWRRSTGASTRMIFANAGRLRDSNDLALTVLYANDRLLEAGSLPESYLATDRRLNYTPGDFFHPEVWHLALRGNRALAGGQLSGNVFWRRNSYEQYNGNIPAPNSDGFVRNLSTGSVVEWTRAGHVGGIATTITTGAEYGHSDVGYRFFAVAKPNVPADSASLAASGCAIPSGLCTDVRTREDDFAVYAQGIASLTSSFSVTAALRADRVRIPIADLLTPQYGGSSSYQRVSPRIGINYEMTDRVRGYAAVNTGFRAPAALELLCASAAAPCALPFALGADPPLRPVAVVDYETGIDLESGSHASLDLVGFVSDVRNDILFAQPSATTGFFQNVPRTRRAGVESSGSFPLSASISLFGSYSHVAASYRATVRLASALDDEPPVVSGDRFPTSPTDRRSLGVALRHSMPRGAFDGAVELRAVSSQFLRGDEANTRPPLPGYATANVRAALHLERASVRAYVTNVFDQKYANFGVYAQNLRGPLGGAPSSGDDLPAERFLTPGSPRLFTIAVSVER